MRPGLLTESWLLIRRRWWHWLSLIQVPLIILAACYLIVVVASSTRFHYSFWNDPPPTEAADRFAVRSLWGLALVTAVVGFFAYGALCQFAMALLHDPDSNPLAAVRRSVIRGLRVSWWGIPLFGLAAAAALSVLPGLLLVPFVAAFPFGVLDEERTCGDCHAWTAMARRSAADSGSLVAIIEGVVVLATVVSIFATQGLTIAAGRFIPVFVFLSGWMATTAVGIAVAWVVVALAMLQLPAPSRPAEN